MRIEMDLALPLWVSQHRASSRWVWRKLKRKLSPGASRSRLVRVDPHPVPGEETTPTPAAVAATEPTSTNAPDATANIGAAPLSAAPAASAGAPASPPAPAVVAQSQSQSDAADQEPSTPPPVTASHTASLLQRLALPPWVRPHPAAGSVDADGAWEEPLSPAETAALAACGCALRKRTVRAMFGLCRRRGNRVMWVSNGVVMMSGPGQDQAAYEHIRKVGIDDQSINRLYEQFDKIDKDGSGQISLDEFHAAMGLTLTDFSQKVFCLLDEDGSGEIDFREFTIAVWNYCTFSSKALATFAFSLFDDDNSGWLESEEVRRLVAAVYGEGFGTNERVKRSMALLDGDEDGLISKAEFLAFNKRQPLLLFPAYQMQESLRRTIVGVEWWKALAEARDKKFRQQNIFEILAEINEKRDAEVGSATGPAGSNDKTRTIRVGSVSIGDKPRHEDPAHYPQPVDVY